MHLCRTRIALGLFAVIATLVTVQAAVVYKWTDADGVIHFSDQSVPGAEKIVTSSGTSHGVNLSVSSGAPAAKPKAPGTALASQLVIDSPAHDETITGNQPVNVHLTVEPELKRSQSISWYLNGNPLTQAPDATQFTLDDLPRGTYTLGATLLDQQSGETKNAENVTFYVVRTSLLSPTHKAP